MSERTAQGHLLELERRGLLRIERRGGRHLTNRYFVLQNPAESAPFTEKPRRNNTVIIAENPADFAENPADFAPQSKGILKESKGGGNDPPSSKSKPQEEPNGYPLPEFKSIPSPLYRGTAEIMLSAIQEQVETVNQMAKVHQVPVMATTPEGTTYRIGWKLPKAAEAALEAWEKRRKEITRALAG